MNEQYLKNVIEAALLAAGKPLGLDDFIGLFDEARRPAKGDVQAALAALAAEYADRGIEVKETAAGFRVQVRRELADEVSRLWPERPARYSRALLETLALIAYRQPITRGEIEAVRGVAVNPNIVKTLLERSWVRVVGQRDVPGRPELLGTTREFLDYFGLKSLDELPPLAELKAMGDLNVQLDFAATRSGEQAAGGDGAAGAEPAGSQSRADSEPGVVEGSEPRSVSAPAAAAGAEATAGQDGEATAEPSGESGEAGADSAGGGRAARGADSGRHVDLAELPDELDAAADDELDDDEESSEDPESSQGLVAASRPRS